jgi:hypothetical protein
LLWNYDASLLRLCLRLRSLRALSFRSLWRRNTFTARLLLRWPHRTFSSRRIRLRAFNSLLLTLRIPFSALWPLDSTTSRLFHRPRLFRCSWLFHRSRLFRSLCCLRRRAAIASTLTLTLVAHLELLSLRTIGRGIHSHRLR